MRATDALGLDSGTVAIVPYDVRWTNLFEEARSELRAAMGQSILDVHHVGSTAVPGLRSKPVLDLLVTISDLRAGAVLVPQLSELGYEAQPDDIPDRLFFRRRRGSIRTHHLSLAEPESHYYAVTVAFRDALRRDEALAASYGELKSQLARRFPKDRPVVPGWQDGVRAERGSANDGPGHANQPNIGRPMTRRAVLSLLVIGVVIAVVLTVSRDPAQPLDREPFQGVATVRTASVAEQTAEPVVQDSAQTAVESADLQAMSETFRNTTFLLAIRDAGFLCEDVVGSYSGGGNVWTASCRDMRGYTITAGAAAALVVEPVVHYFDALAPTLQTPSDPLRLDLEQRLELRELQRPR